MYRSKRTCERFTSFRDVVRSKTEEQRRHTSSNDVAKSSYKPGRNPHGEIKAVSRLSRVKGFWSTLLFMKGKSSSSDARSSEDSSGRSMDVAKAICKDYIHQKLLFKGYSTRKMSLYAANCEYSDYFVKAGRILERLYPKVYTDVSRKISMTMTSSTAVKSTLTTVLEIMFRENITWGKIVSMFAISASFAEECVQQGHSEFVDDVINCVGNFVALHLVEWLVKEGGWTNFEQAFVGSQTVGLHIVVGVLTALVGFVTTLTFIVDLS